jgi:hypothetical protein
MKKFLILLSAGTAFALASCSHSAEEKTFRERQAEWEAEENEPGRVD